MIHPRLTASVATSALAPVLALAVAACGDKDAAGKSDTPRPAAAATTAPGAVAPVLQTASETKQFRDWSATCGNDGTCWAFGFTSGGDGGWLRITLDPGADARPHILFGYWPDSDAKGPPRTSP